jgi:hypothetical protein
MPTKTVQVMEIKYDSKGALIGQPATWGGTYHITEEEKKAAEEELQNNSKFFVFDTEDGKRVLIRKKRIKHVMFYEKSVVVRS